MTPDKETRLIVETLALVRRVKAAEAKKQSEKDSNNE